MSEALKQQLREEHDLWFPGDPLTAELSSPTPEELRSAFATYVMPGRTVISLEGSLSALTVPAERPRGYALLDIDDCVNDLCGSIRSLQHSDPLPVKQRRNNHDYGDGMWFTNKDEPIKHQLFALIRSSLMGVAPTEGIDQIRDIMASWRERGIYVGFISSQTPGSELPTTTNFLGRYFAGVCDFLVVPDGHYTLADKGTAAKSVLEQWGYDETTPVIGIDDIPFNTAKLRTAVQTLEPQPQIQTFQPIMPSHLPRDMGSEHAPSTLDAFRFGDSFFHEQHERNLGRTLLVAAENAA